MSGVSALCRAERFGKVDFAAKPGGHVVEVGLEQLRGSRISWRRGRSSSIFMSTTMRPGRLAIRITRSLSRMASSRSWVTKMTVGRSASQSG